MLESNIQQTLKKYGQEHIINYIDALTDEEKKHIPRDCSA